MKRFAFALFVCLGLVTPSFVHNTFAAEAEASEAETAKPLADQLKEQPDDKSMYDKYMLTNLGEVRSLLGTDLDAAEKQLAEMKALIESLEPKTDAGKQIVERAKRAIQLYGRQVEIGRAKLDDLIAKLEENPDDTDSISIYHSKLMSLASPLTRTEPDKAEELLNAAKKLLASMKEKTQEDATKKAIEGIERSFGRLEQGIATGKKLVALVGADAAPLEVEAWVNGEPLTDSDLKGKVVLLDFWSIWCGPCIATFPHLREWHEKYAEKGLVIIGLTRYYGYTWDDEAGRPKRAANREDVTPEQEQEMLVKFAENHNLHHRFAIQKGSALSEYYAVSGIPHVVVIDREGKIRLFRIGSGEKNAKDVAEMIEKLIADA